MWRGRSLGAIGGALLLAGSAAAMLIAEDQEKRYPDATITEVYVDGNETVILFKDVDGGSHETRTIDPIATKIANANETKQVQVIGVNKHDEKKLTKIFPNPR